MTLCGLFHKQAGSGRNVEASKPSKPWAAADPREERGRGGDLSRSKKKKKQEQKHLRVTITLKVYFHIISIFRSCFFLILHPSEAALN